MNEIQSHRDQENEAFGFFLIKAIADHIGIEPDPKKIDRAVYKGTDCGAWVQFDSDGVVIGSIVEGSEAEYSERIDLDGIEPSDEGAELLNERFWAALDRCEEFCEEAWNETNGQDEEEE
jgi:hypothetical protein